MSRTSHTVSADTLVIARTLVAPAVALALLLSLAFAVQPAAAGDVAGYQSAVLQVDGLSPASYVTPAGFKRFGHFKRHHGFKKHGAFKRHHGFRKGFVFKRHRGLGKHGVFKRGHGFRHGFFAGHRGFKGHRRFH